MSRSSLDTPAQIKVISDLTTLSEETVDSTVYHHLSQISVDIRLSGLIKFRCSNAADSGDLLFPGLDVTL